MKIFRLLETYRRGTLVMPLASAKAANKAERLNALQDIVEECEALGRGTANKNAQALLFNYSSACTKRAKAIEHSEQHWGSVKAVFQPSYAGNATARAAQRIGFMPKAKTLSGHDYWLEKLDPRHHSWRQGSLMTLFHQWEADDVTSLNLWDWLEQNGSAAAKELQECVIYLAPDKQWENACDFDALGLARRLPASVGGVGDLIWTKPSNAVRVKSQLFYNPAFWAYVISPSGGLYIHHHEADYFHHSSFLAGGRVLGAGMIGLSKGQIVYINNKSGHYQPSPAEFYIALKTLTSKYPSLDPKKFAIEIIDAPNGSYLAWADDFLASKGNYQGFEGPLDTTDDPKKKAGWLRRLCAQMIQNGDMWADVPESVKATVKTTVAIVAEKAALAKAGEIELLFYDGLELITETVVRGGPMWNELRAKGWRTAQERPDWDF
jgi:hypothetical protein